MNSDRIRPVAIFLPQFHPIPENDEWWGKGFTEWRNVVQARPRFRGHYQPHLPADLGFYDLRVPEVRQQQADLARQFGIHGFCYYHYWFNGRRILERPARDLLETGQPDFPFMLCWANENWTRIWDGSEKSVLLRQEYSEEDHRLHAEMLMPYFADPRYIRINGKPVFAIYKDGVVPNVDTMAKVFREVAKEHGLELYLIRFIMGNSSTNAPPRAIGFDGEAEFQPVSPVYFQYLHTRRRHVSQFLKRKARLAMKRLLPPRQLLHLFRNSTLNDEIVNYSDFIEYDIAHSPVQRDQHNGACFPGVCPSWDNTPRRMDGSAIIFHGSTPDLFQKWVQAKTEMFHPLTPDENLLFVNAWNEWAEGNHLEPCLKYGHQYLEALRRGVAAGLLRKP